MHLKGMVSVCCGCDGLYPWSACLVGSVGAGVYMIVGRVMKKLGIDDPLEAIAVHGGGGEKHK